MNNGTHNGLDALAKEIARVLSEEILQNVKEGLIYLRMDQNKPAINTDPPVSQKEICNFLNISSPTLVKMRRRKEIPFSRAGRKFLYNKADVSAAIEKKGGAR